MDFIFLFIILSINFKFTIMDINKQITQEELTKYRLISIELLDNLLNQVYTSNKGIFDLYNELLKVKEQKLVTNKNPDIKEDIIEENVTII